MSLIPSLKLNTGASMPAIGLGAAAGFTSEEIIGSKDRILGALKLGYRHVDTAMIYGTEGIVGAAVREFGIAWEEIFVKGSLTENRWPHMEYTPRSFNDSLSAFGFNYLDMSIRYPDLEDIRSGFKILETPTLNDNWAALEKIYASGKVKAIGVSNFYIKTLEQLFKTAKVVPAVSQIELHPYLAQTELVEYCQKRGIAVTAYSPTGRIRLAKVRGDPLIVELAGRYKVSQAQITAIPKTREYRSPVPVLSSGDVARITGLDRGERFVSKLQPDGTLYGWTSEQYGW
ncbi:NADP-dependent oxidoreductase domain-containing protein [Mycena rebaudengoi]|nr:NADP-dependent oxidoreductase domain-containing protein [Mycena rebaudengoi]